MKSLISNEKACYVCGCPVVHKHHIFYGTANRRLSEEYGCWVWLCPYHHNMSKEGVHFNRELDLQIKKECQECWEQVHGSRADFIKVFGRSWA